jgi:hypothetical protein
MRCKAMKVVSGVNGLLRQGHIYNHRNRHDLRPAGTGKNYSAQTLPKIKLNDFITSSPTPRLRDGSGGRRGLNLS